MVRTFNPSTQEAVEGGSLSSTQGQPGLQIQFQDSQGYMEKLCLKTSKKLSLLFPFEFIRLFNPYVYNVYAICTKFM